MEAMIKNDEEKVWMTPLLELRNALDVADDRPLRDFRRMSGQVQLFHDRTIPGPYTKEAREDWLRPRARSPEAGPERGAGRVPEPEPDHPGRAARDPPHLAEREARVRRQPAGDLPGGHR